MFTTEWVYWQKTQHPRPDIVSPENAMNRLLPIISPFQLIASAREQESHLSNYVTLVVRIQIPQDIAVALALSDAEWEDNLRLLVCGVIWRHIPDSEQKLFTRLSNATGISV